MDNFSGKLSVDFFLVLLQGKFTQVLALWSLTSNKHATQHRKCKLSMRLHNLKIAIKMRDLHGNPSNRIKNYSQKFWVKSLTLFSWCVLASCVCVFLVLIQCDFGDLFDSQVSTPAPSLGEETGEPSKSSNHLRLQCFWSYQYALLYHNEKFSYWAWVTCAKTIFGGVTQSSVSCNLCCIKISRQLTEKMSVYHGQIMFCAKVFKVKPIVNRQLTYICVLFRSWMATYHSWGEQGPYGPL